MRRLVEVRKQLGLRQIDLARKAHVSQAAVSKLENGRGAGRFVATQVWEALGRRIALDYLLSAPKPLKAVRQ